MCDTRAPEDERFFVADNVVVNTRQRLNGYAVERRSVSGGRLKKLSAVVVKRKSVAAGKKRNAVVVKKRRKSGGGRKEDRQLRLLMEEAHPSAVASCRRNIEFTIGSDEAAAHIDA